MHFQERIELPKLLDKAGTHRQSGMPFVLYRNPNSTVVRGIFQESPELHEATNFLEAGFIFAPFLSKDKTILILADRTYHAVCQSSGNQDPSKNQPPQGEGAGHITLVNKAISHIKIGTFEKVVLSQSFQQPIKDKPSDVFLRALEKYPSAFCYLWHHPKVGTWLGASPEQLAKTKAGGFHTTALAGTLPYQEGVAPLWTFKEYEEQEMVTSYLKEKLGDYLEAITTEDRQSVKAGKLWHLKTNISGKLRSDCDLKALIDAIHPTSAVCGLPKKKALDFILENETYHRTYYTGFLGSLYLEAKEDVSFFVNLRCMQLEEGMATIYVGGGITKDSVAEKEWGELLGKTGTMLALL